MNTNRLYWITKGLMAAFMLMASIPDVLRIPQAVEVFTHLGYPTYLLPFLGTAKILGVMAILVPGFPRLREWAYAGLVFDLVGAWYSHVSVGDPPGAWMLPVTGLLLVIGSYVVDRRQAGPTRATIKAPIGILALCAGSLVQVACSAQRSDAPRSVDPALTQLGGQFVSRTADVNGTTLHYVRGGSGPGMILVHGFPQDWSVFHRIMPRLSGAFTVVAVDLRGIGGSSATPNGYDAATLAEDIHQLARHLALEKPYVAGHDNGGMVAYALGRRHPEGVRGVMILDVPIPGLDPWDQQVTADPTLWHFGFHQTPNAPEHLIAGREAVYFREVFFNPMAHNRAAISDEDVTHYVRSHASPAQLRAGLEVYRAYPENERFNRIHTEPIDVPIVLAGGSHSMAPLNPAVAKALQDHGWRNVSVEVVANSGHWVVDEQPTAVAELLERYAAR